MYNPSPIQESLKKLATTRKQLADMLIVYAVAAPHVRFVLRLDNGKVWTRAACENEAVCGAT